MNCETCLFWKPLRRVATFEQRGECHRLPPRDTGRWPVTGKDDDCGEFRARQVEFATTHTSQSDAPTKPAAAAPEELPLGAAAAQAGERMKTRRARAS